MVLAGKIFWQITHVQLLKVHMVQERLTIKVPPVMSTFWAFAKRSEPESVWQLSAKAKGKQLSYSQRDFGVIQIWHRATRTIIEWGWPKTWARKPIVGKDNHENCYTTSKKRLTLKVPPVMTVFGAFAK